MEKKSQKVNWLSQVYLENGSWNLKWWMFVCAGEFAVLMLTVVGVMWIGKLVSVCQLSLTQLLLMVVSTGFGINRWNIDYLYYNNNGIPGSLWQMMAACCPQSGTYLQHRQSSLRGAPLKFRWNGGGVALLRKPAVSKLLQRQRRDSQWRMQDFVNVGAFPPFS